MLNNWDHQLFLFLNGLHVGWLDPVMTFISSEMGWIPFYAVLLFFVFYKYRWKGLWVLLGVVVVITCSDQISASVFKPIFHRLRPCYDPLIEEHQHRIKRNPTHLRRNKRHHRVEPPNVQAVEEQKKLMIPIV